MLAGPRLALRGLDDHPGRLHRRPHRAEERLVEARREDVVVEDVRHRGREVVVVLRVRLEVGLAEEEELELRAEHRLEAERVRLLHLRLQHLARRRGDGRPVVPLDVALHHHRGLVPGDPAQRGEVGPEPEVAVAALPARDRVPRDRDPSPSRARAGSCSPRPGGPASFSSRKNSASSRFPIRRPCMSVKQAMTVSTVPAATSSRSSSRRQHRCQSSTKRVDSGSRTGG